MEFLLNLWYEGAEAPFKKPSAYFKILGATGSNWTWFFHKFNGA